MPLKYHCDNCDEVIPNDKHDGVEFSGKTGDIFRVRLLVCKANNLGGTSRLCPKCLRTFAYKYSGLIDPDFTF